jgi:type I restriction enzyme S subunit
MGWEVKTLKEVAEQSSTVDPRKEPQEEFKYIDVSSVSNKSFSIEKYETVLGKNAPSRARRLVREGDVLFATIRPTLRRVAIVPAELDEQVCSTGYFVFRPQEKLNNRFLYYYLQSDGFIKEMEALQAGASYPAVNNTQVQNQTIPIPPIREQKRIVAILDEAFADIDKASALTERNLESARELFESYLSEIFVRAERSAEKVTLDEASGGVLTGPFGSLLHKSDYIDGGVPLINPAHITATGIAPDNKKTVSQETKERLNSYVMSEGDIVIGRRGEMGRCATVTQKEDGFLCGTGSFFIKSSERIFSPYLVRFLRSNTGKSRLEKLAGGAVMPNLSNSQLSKLKVPLPVFEEQRKIADKIDTLSENVERIFGVYRQKSLKLEELKKSLLQKAFTGELTKAA